MLRLLARVWSRLWKTIELARYDDFTIAEYFRRQGAKIGSDTCIEVRFLGTEPFLVKIGSRCTISTNVNFMTHDGGVRVFSNEMPGIQKFGSITIFSNCFIGANAMILPRVKIGPNSVVGACALVSKDVPPNCVVAGNPARVISSLDEYREKVFKSWRNQMPAGYFSGLTAGVAYSQKTIQDLKNRESSTLRRHLTKLFYEDQGKFHV